MEKQSLSSLNHCVYSLSYHLVLVTKYRRKVFTREIINRAEDIFRDTLQKWSCSLIEFNGEQDHVHLLFGTPPNLQLSVLVNNLKTVSSRLLRRDFSEHFRKTYWKPVLWSRTYCILSSGGAPIEVIRKYIENQNTPD